MLIENSRFIVPSVRPVRSVPRGDELEMSSVQLIPIYAHIEIVVAFLVDNTSSFLIIASYDV